MEKPNSWTTTNYYSETGEQLSSETLGDDQLNGLQYVYGIAWQSPWRESDPDYQDSVTVYRTKDGYWAVFDYQCGGYSSVTFEPESVVNIVTSENFNVFWNIGLTDNQREKLVACKTKVGKFLYV